MSLLGGDNNLVVVLGIYEPNVQCRGVFGSEWTSCRDVLGDMPTGKRMLIFGPRSAPEVQQGLPVLIDSCKRDPNALLLPFAMLMRTADCKPTINASFRSSQPENPTLVLGIVCGRL